MPGIFGIFDTQAKREPDRVRKLGEAMKSALALQPWLRSSLVTGDFWCLGRVCLPGSVRADEAVWEEDNRSVCVFDGELYREERAGGDGPREAEVSSWIGQPRKLADVDGVFSVAVVDRFSRELVLMSDRLGLRPFYWMEHEGLFAFAASVEALLRIRSGLPRLDALALRSFLTFGYILGDRTWWEGISAVPPGVVMRVRAEKIDARRYWTFDDIPEQPPLAQEDAAREFGQRWSRSVKQRSRPGVMPLQLSGGLDSRLLACELRRQEQRFVAITWGERWSRDVRIARTVARRLGVEHHLRYIRRDNWWHERPTAITVTDGMANVLDLHCQCAAETMRTGNAYSPMCMAGDLVFGGSYLCKNTPRDWKSGSEDLLTPKAVHNPFFTLPAVLDDLLPDTIRYAEGRSTDCFFLLQRVRRCTLNGPTATSAHAEAAYPSLSRDVLDLFYSGAIQDSARAGARFYHGFLIDRHPDLFNTVRCQATGHGLRESFSIRLRHSLLCRIEAAVFQLRGRDVYDLRRFSDYAQYLRSGTVQRAVLRGDLLADEHLDGQARQILLSKPRSFAEAYVIGGLLTLETYLRHVSGLL